LKIVDINLCDTYNFVEIMSSSLVLPNKTGREAEAGLQIGERKKGREGSGRQ